MKKLIFRLLSVFLQTTNQWLCSIGLIRPKIIIYMDGGICSQLHVYLCGELYRRARLEVLFDVYWFEKDGKDLDGKFDRNLELGKLFPNLSFKAIKRRKAWFYRNFFSVTNQQGLLPEPNSIRRTTYLGGFYHLYPTDEFKAMFQHCFGMKHYFDILVHIPQSADGTSCAVHIRRGDLANRDAAFYATNPWYKPLPDKYFFDTIQYVSEHYKNVCFYLFSDELDWVEMNLCPKITAPYQLMRGNKAFEDLALLSECDMVISSQGSFGKMGARLNGSSDVIIPAPETEQGFVIKNFSKEVF